MTACRNKARGAVVAALAGALTLGAAPVMALADGASLQSADAGYDFQLGEVLTAYDGNNNLLDLGSLEFEVGDTARNKITVTKAVTGSGVPVTDGDFTVYYYKFTDANKDGKASLDELDGTAGGNLGTTMPATAGNYAAVVMNSNYGSGRIVLTIKVVNNSLQGAYVIDGTSYTAANGYDLDDTTITYDGSSKGFSLVNYDCDGDGTNDAPRLVVALGDKTLVSGDDFEAKTFDSEGNAIDGYPMVAGDYTVILTGKNGSHGDFTNSNVEVPFSIGQFNLSSATVTLDSGAVQYDGEGHEPAISAVEGLDNTADGIGSLKLVAKNGVAFNKGHYTYDVTLSDGATDAAKASITDTGSAALDVVDSVVNNFKYGTDTFGTDLDQVVYLSNSGHFVFDADEVSATDALGNEVPSEYLVYDIVNEWTGEKSNDPSVINTPGKWNVTVRVDAQNEKNNFTYGGVSGTATITVYNGEVKDATFLVSYDGKTQGSYQVTYNGEDYLDDIQVKVFDANGALLTAGEDYEVVVEKDGEPVSEIVDHGNYKISVKSDEYDVSTTSACAFTVDPVTLSNSNVFIEGKFADKNFLSYTGEELTPGYKWLVSGDAEDDDAVWMTLPTDLYTVTYYDEDGKECKLQEVGTYSAEIRVHDEKGNFKTVEFTKAGINVSDTKVFADVPNDQWYSEYVYKAASAGYGYINGYGDGTFFGPADDISRADVVKVLFNMAGKPGSDDKDEGSTDADKTFDLPYSDCDEGAYYAQALQWATKLGIVSGDEGKDTFRPTDSVTREELAKIMYNYMALQGETEDVDADAVLGEYEDESSVSAWAREYVAWLVEQGVMGQDSGLEGNKAISRAEVATMAVRLQPNGALKDTDFVK